MAVQSDGMEQAEERKKVESFAEPYNDMLCFVFKLLCTHVEQIFPSKIYEKQRTLLNVEVGWFLGICMTHLC